jgi:DNA replication and repair protein RecF
LILASVTANNFRNLEPDPIAFHAQTNLVVGRNGQGKTNLLEAIYFLATTKSFRTPRLANVVRFEQPSVFVSGALQRQRIEKVLSIGVEAAESRRRVLMVNEESVSLHEYLAAMSVFAYSAARLEILRGAPEERRRFLDRGVASINPAYLQDLTRYARVLRQRNALLQSGSHGSLEAWDAEFAISAAAVQRARASYAGELSTAFGEIVARHGYHVRDLQMTYRPSSVDDLARVRRLEIRARTSLAGPQRDNIEFAIEGRNAAEVLSGGEQKMIILFLKFAKLELFRRRHGESALFLLDDLDAELDLEILQNLLSRLPSETQLFATSAKEPVVDALQAGPHRRLLIEKGRVIDSRDFS